MIFPGKNGFNPPRNNIANRRNSEASMNGSEPFKQPAGLGAKKKQLLVASSELSTFWLLGTCPTDFSLEIQCQQIRCQESGHDRVSLLPATLLPKEPRLLAFHGRNWQCQPALLLHWYGNRPAARMILQAFLSTWCITGQYESMTRNETHTFHQVVSKTFSLQSMHSLNSY